jgi:hypothetical protein
MRNQILGWLGLLIGGGILIDLVLIQGPLQRGDPRQANQFDSLFVGCGAVGMGIYLLTRPKPSSSVTKDEPKDRTSAPPPTNNGNDQSQK